MQRWAYLIAAALLLQSGIPVVSQRDYRSLGLLGARLDPRWAPSPGDVDFHRSPWVLDNLPQPSPESEGSAEGRGSSSLPGVTK